MDHPADEILVRFVKGTASRDESRAVVSHLLKGCILCARRIRALMEPNAVAAGSYDVALDRFSRELIESLAASISPTHALRTMLAARLELMSTERGPSKKD